MPSRLHLAGAMLLTLLPGALSGQARDYTPHFRVYTGQGEAASLHDITQAMAAADVVFIGESHTDPVAHFLEAELFRAALAGAGARPVALSLEMFERDAQLVLDEYLAGIITEEQFTRSARAWDYYATDYRPLVELAKAATVPVLAANAPRRYVNRVSRLGRAALDQLSPEARRLLAPLPYPEPSAAYRREWQALMADMPMQPQCPPPAGPAGERPAAPPAAARDTARRMPPSHGTAFMENGLQAQALWDATMAHTIATFLATHAGALVVHVAGGFHVENGTGTPEQLQHYRPDARSLVVSLEPADDFRSFDSAAHAGQGDFVILTDRSLDLDYERNCRPAQRRP